jgi:A/G-specific adenine glycosylase
MSDFLPPETHLPQIQAALLNWFAVNKRPLPWRNSYTPYEVWISEVMLQQTQIGRGVEYFTRWMKRFPDIGSLAAATEDEVLRLWEGLGYYSRARHILSAARAIVEKHGSRFPSDPEQIRALPGIGPYTAGAVLSIAFGERLPCVDANVERVLSRVFNIDTPVKEEPAAGKIREWALRLVPAGAAREHNQALMELGALVCGKTPRCPNCPLAAFCSSKYLDVTELRPVRGKKATAKAIEVVTGLLWRKGKVFVQKRLPKGVWGNLWEFPGGRVEASESPDDAVIREFMEETGFSVASTGKYCIIKHGYTTYKIRLHCYGLRLKQTSEDIFPAPARLTAATDWQWAGPGDVFSLPMPAPHRKLAGMAFGGKHAQLVLGNV